MTKTVLIVLGVVVLVLIGAALFFFQTPEEASAPIAAVTLVVETAEPTAVAAATVAPTAETAVEPAEQPAAEPDATEAPAVEDPTAEPTAAAESTATAEPVEEPAAAAPLVFEIVSAESQARFVINEVLRGSPKTVVGATDQVSGQLAVDPSNPASAQVGVILINARTLATDSSMRDRALKNWILETDAFEYVTFEPTEIIGMPESVTVGEAFSFQLAGDLTVRETTVPVTFDVTVTPVSEERLEGLATLTLPYRDLNVTIPDSPSVDTVDDALTLELEFVAALASDA